MNIGNKVKVKGTSLEGIIISTRIVHVTKTERGKLGEVKLIKVKHPNYEMEYE